MRGILEERQTRSYLAFILLLAAAMVAAACLLGWRQTDRMRALYFQWEGRVSSGLLGEGGGACGHRQSLCRDRGDSGRREVPFAGGLHGGDHAPLAFAGPL